MTESHPAGLRDAGRNLWAAIADDFELDQREQALLATACRQADDVANLEALLAAEGLSVPGSKGQPRLSAVVSELRQGRLALAKLLDALKLPAEAKPETEASARARKAVNTRWDLARQRAVRG